MNIDDALQTFIAESRDLLREMEDALLRCEHSQLDPELVNALFRAAHTIKGSAGLFGLDHIVKFTHAAESVLDKVRSAELELGTELVAMLLESRDHISLLIDQVSAGSVVLTPDIEETSQRLIDQLFSHIGKTEGIQQPTTPVALPAEHPQGDRSESEHWHLSLRFGADVLRSGMDPLSFLRYLSTLGHVEHIVTLPDAMPAESQMDPESCYLGFEVAFRSEAKQDDINGVFDFVREDSQILILPPHSQLSDYFQLIESVPEDDERIGDILLKCGTLTPSELSSVQAMRHPSHAADTVSLVPLEMQKSNAQPAELKQVKENKSTDNRFIRVDAEKLDQLINLVGELIICGAGTGQIAQNAGIPELLESTSTLQRLVEEVRDSALNLRMVQIGSTFSRFQRVVRDVSLELGKEIELVVNGAETELDKTVVEKIGDPLTHLVRNAMDHGIEPADARREAGKPEKGTLRLNAYHDSGSIVIEVADDGRGLNRDRIFAKAVERGLISEGQTLSDREIYNLIFEAGFSTADQVSNLSGRGVGMDVVRRNIENLRGSVELESHEGVGTTVRIRLPLTLAIIDGFLVGVGDSAYVLPLEMVEECIELAAWDCQSDGKEYLKLRGEVLPYIRLHDYFSQAGQRAERESVVVVRYAGQKAGLVVDKLMGEFQTVIKRLGKVFSKTKDIGGFTILGSGDVALVLDVGGLLHQVEHEQMYPVPYNV